MAGHWKEEANSVAGPAGVLFLSHAVVHVEANIEADGFLFLGTSSAASPRSIPTAERIQRVEKFPTVRQDLTVYVAYV